MRKEKREAETYEHLETLLTDGKRKPTERERGQTRKNKEQKGDRNWEPPDVREHCVRKASKTGLRKHS